eukprot:513682_1
MAQPKNALLSTVTVDIGYNQVTKINCSKCYKNFENSGKAVKALNKYWHVGCFKCIKCKLKIIGKYQEKGQGAECAECLVGGDDIFGNFEEFLGDEEVKRIVPGTKYNKCSKCKKNIIDKGCTDQDGKMYHQKCFACDECGGSIAGQPYGTDDKGKKVCQKCMAKYQQK